MQPLPGGSYPVPGLTWAGRQSFGSYLQNQDCFPGSSATASWVHPARTPAGPCSHRRAVRVERLRDPASLPGLEPGAWRGLGSGSCPHWGLVLLAGLARTSSHSLLTISQFSHTSPGSHRVARKHHETRRLHGCPESGEGALASLTTSRAPHACSPVGANRARGCPGHPVSWFQRL